MPISIIIFVASFCFRKGKICAYLVTFAPIFFVSIVNQQFACFVLYPSLPYNKLKTYNVKSGSMTLFKSFLSTRMKKVDSRPHHENKLICFTRRFNFLVYKNDLPDGL